MEDYELMKEKDEGTIEKTQKIPLLHLKRDQLAALCQSEHMTVTDEAPRASLIELLLNAGYPKSIPLNKVPHSTAV